MWHVQIKRGCKSLLWLGALRKDSPLCSPSHLTSKEAFVQTQHGLSLETQQFRRRYLLQEPLLSSSQEHLPKASKQEPVLLGRVVRCQGPTCVLHMQCFSLQYELILPQNTGRRVPWSWSCRTCMFPCEHVSPQGVTDTPRYRPPPHPPPCFQISAMEGMEPGGNLVYFSTRQKGKGSS